ncbi:hypothetical protein ACQKNC_09720 [Lysinibacillus sp. NPDC094177]|uniref:hypothetical protein n=1 Tax=Lysinibacillus sp. NPDC094177 TaxID=3390580 RepID=UPI003D04C288
MKNNIYHPDEIFSFLEKAIEATNGRLNVDFYGGGYSDELCAIKRINDFFYLYWKDFEDYFSRIDELTELEIIDYQSFGGNTYIYQVMNINNLEILENDGDIYIVVRCNYTTKKELYSSLVNTFKVSKEKIIEIESGHYIEFLFKDSNGYNHSCQLIPFPINSVMIQEKNNPLDESVSKVIMDMVLINEFKELYNAWLRELSSLEDYINSRQLKNLGSEIRLESERLLKYYILYKHYEMDYKEFEKISSEILSKYSHLTLGDLKKKISTIDIPNNFIVILNALAHDSGKPPMKSDLDFVLENFRNILDENFKI